MTTRAEKIRAELKLLAPKTKVKLPQDVGKYRLSGRMVEQADETVSFATEAGIVEIAIEDIEAIEKNGTEGHVTITLKKGGAIRPRSGVFGIGGHGGVSTNFESSTYTYGECLDTRTITGGEADATDDTFGCDVKVDDYRV